MKRSLPQIKKQDIIHYLGCKQSDERLDLQIHTACKTLQQLASIHIIYQIADVQGYHNTLAIPLHGNDMKQLLAQCDQAIFMAATLGIDVDRECKRLAIKDMSSMLVFDAVCNAAIEAVADEFQKEQRLLYASKKRYLSDRFSCGYGDLSITIQHAFCAALDTRRKIGLYVNDANVLIPMKSITAIIGISDYMQQKRIMGCNACDLQHHCMLRKGGKHCG